MTIETTPRLGLPLLHAAQAQKEWTHNEALTLLDALAGAVLAGGPLDAPPADPAPGGVWRVGATPSGEWSGRAGWLAVASPAGWRFADPPAGFVLARAGDGAPVRRTADGWQEGALALDSLVLAGRAVGGAAAQPVDDPVGGATVDAEARAALVRLLAALRAQGLVA